MFLQDLSHGQGRFAQKLMVESKGDLLIGIAMLVKRISSNISPITMVIIYGYIYPAIDQYFMGHNI
jgi:hypothetical protein